MPSLNYRLSRCIYIFIIAPCATLGVMGCGLSEQSLFAEPDDAGRDNPGAQTIMFDWTGGVSPIMGDDELPGLDLEQFRTIDGGTLAEVEAAFKSRVLDEVERIYTELAIADLVFEDGESNGRGDDTIILMTQADSAGMKRFGEGEYDPCNEHHDDVAIIFGDELRAFGGTMAFDEWVTVFANAAAHEIGHTLGFGHVSREEYPPNARALYVEIMYDQHTMEEMRRPQRFVIEQSTCDHE